MKRFFIVFFLLCTGYLTQAQYSFQAWHNGYLVTIDHDTVAGNIQYNMKTNTVTVAQGEAVRAFSSYKIFYLEFFDSVLKHYRQFYTIPYTLRSQYETPVLFELLYEGEMSLLAREKIVQEPANMNAFGFQGSQIMQNVVDHDFYFLSKDGQISYYDESKTNLYIILRDKETKVRKFIKDNKLKHDVMRDLIRITSFYNSI